MTEPKINSYVLKINGKVEIPSELVAGHNYEVKIEGSVPSFEMSDNENGTFDITYKLKPIRLELVNEKGVTLKAKDPRSNSEKMRAQVRAIHLDKGINCPFEEFYDKFCALQRHNANDTAEAIIKANNW